MWRSKTAVAPSFAEQLAELLMHSVDRLSQPGADTEAGCNALANELLEIGADPEQVRSLACEVVYEGDSDLAEALMGHLARFGYGAGAITVKQPERVPVPIDNSPQLCATNLLAELASPEPYSAVLLGENNVGAATLIRALIGAQLRHPCEGITIAVADLVGEPHWSGLEAVPNTVWQLPPRDADFFKLVGDLLGQVAREIQSRVAQRSIRGRSPHLGADRWPAYMLIVNGWQAVTEELSLLSKKQIHDHEYAGQLLRDFRYCLSAGPSVSVSTVVSADRIDNCALAESALESARVFALGAVRPGGKGGYRAIDALLTNKNRIPDPRDRLRLSELLSRCKAEQIPVVLALSGSPRLGLFKDFRDDALSLRTLYEARRSMK